MDDTSAYLKWEKIVERELLNASSVMKCALLLWKGMCWNGRRGRLELNCKVYCQLSKMCLFVPAFIIIIFV